MANHLTAREISDFFDSSIIERRSLFPHLVRKLILELSPIENLVQMRIPAGDQVGQPGFDGIIESKKSLLFIPEGKSAWEMGIGNDPQEKAQSDYRTRIDNGQSDLDTVFVFVTPHEWSQESKGRWINNRKEESNFKDIKVIDFEDLETWLELCPATSVWFLSLMGRSVSSFTDFGKYYEREINDRYGYESIPEDLIIGGRDEEEQRIIEWVVGSSKNIKIIGETLDEPCFFFAAVIKKMEKEKSCPEYSSKILYVHDIQNIEFLTSRKSRIIAVVTDPEIRRHMSTLEGPDIRVISVDNKILGNKDIAVCLSKIKRSKVFPILIGMGFQQYDAERNAEESKGSLTALLWMIDKNNDQPISWKSSESANRLIPLLFAGQWSEKNEHDKIALSEMSGGSYEKIREVVEKWKGNNNPLISREFNIIDWKAWDFNWVVLEEFINSDHKERFINVAKKVLGTKDSSLELDPEKRHMASFEGKTYPYSHQLQKGIMTTTLKFAIDFDNGQQIANQIVEFVLNGEDVCLLERWQSAYLWLPDLAEAAPEKFLDKLELFVQSEDNIREFFKDEHEFFGITRYPHLLWALERLAWNKDCFLRVCLILAKMASVKNEVRYSNKPTKTLWRLLLPLRPAINIEKEDRLNALKMLFERYPDVAWSIATDLFPKPGSIYQDTDTPRWRKNWNKKRKEVFKPEEYFNEINSIFDLLLDVADNLNKLADLVKKTERVDKFFSLQMIDKTLSKIEGLEVFSEEESALMYGVLREIISTHRKHCAAPWSLPEPFLERMEDLHKKFDKKKSVEDYLWIFEPYPNFTNPIPYKDDGDMKEKIKEEQEYIKNEQIKATQEIYNNFGAEGLLELVDKSSYPDIAGSKTSLIDLSYHNRKYFIKELISENKISAKLSKRQVASISFLREDFYPFDDFQKISDFVSDKHYEWNPVKYCILWFALPLKEIYWEKLKELSGDAYEMYWNFKKISPFELQKEDVNYAIKKLCEKERYYAAISIMSNFIKSVPINLDLMIEILEKAAYKSPDDNVMGILIDHDIKKILGFLRKNNYLVKKMANVEMLLFRFLYDPTSEDGVPEIQEMLRTTPEYFVDFLKSIYRSDEDIKNKIRKELSKEESDYANFIYRIFDHWKTVPGLIEEKKTKDAFEGDIPFSIGSVDENALFKWVEESKKLVEEADRVSGFEISLGRILAYSPADNENTWPCLGVRNLLEKYYSEKIAEQICSEVYNRRGCYTVTTNDGRQDRQLVEKFNTYYENIKDNWPKAAKVVKRIADNFEEEAKRRDEKAKFEEFGF